MAVLLKGFEEVNIKKKNGGQLGGVEGGRVVVFQCHRHMVRHLHHFPRAESKDTCTAAVEY